MPEHALPPPALSAAVAQIDSQRRLLAQIEPMRLISSAVGFGLMALFLPPWLAMAAMGLDLLCEGIAFALMQQLDPARHRGRYRLVLALVFMMELAYTIPSLMIWQQPAPFAKALAVGLVSMTLFQLTTVRAIHLPFGMAGWLAVAVSTLLGNGWYWLSHDDLAGLTASTLGVAAAIIYTLAAMHSNHQLHLEISRRSDAADAGNRAKGRFLAQMSHELRTPLNAILGMGEAELAGTRDPGTRERMQTLVASARGLALILDDILEMSALNETGLPIRPVACVPQQVVAATVALFRPVYATAGLRLTLNCAADLPPAALLDPQRLRQCLSNLLSNALKFTETGGVTVQVSYLAQADLLQVDLADTGSGIAADEAERAFQPFQRGGKVQSGSGLGLAISRGLARQMGGDLVLLPSAQGALFRLTLRVTPQPVGAARVPEQPLDLSGRRVLVVDDIATNRLVAAAYLRRLAATVAEAESGDAALAAIRESCPDLVLLDMNMPGLSGLETLAQIRTLPGRHLPVLAMTADASSHDRARYLAAGFDGYLAKPLTLESVSIALGPHLRPTSPKV